MINLSIVKKYIWGLRSLYSQYISPYIDSNYGKFGKHTIVLNNSILVKQNMYLDDYVVIQNKVNFISNKGKLKVGKYSVISSGCTIIPGSHKLTVGVPFYLATTNHINDNEGDIVIEEDCWIGAGCILLPKCRVGRGAVVGAGSVVKKYVPPYAVVVGSPARIIATKFTVDEIIKHENILYPPDERMTKLELESLFSEKYVGLKSIGEDSLSDEDNYLVDEIRRAIGMTNYSV